MKKKIRKEKVYSRPDESNEGFSQIENRRVLPNKQVFEEAVEQLGEILDEFQNVAVKVFFFLI